MSALLLAIEKAGTTDRAVARAVWDVTTRDGKTSVYNIADGLEALRAGEEINYSGASGSIEFDEEGMVPGRDFQLSEIRDGKDVVLQRLEF
jgi:branched-chain amino acid transport system substrate-binding protein